MGASLFRSEALKASGELHIGEQIWDPWHGFSRRLQWALLAPALVVMGMPFYRFPHFVDATGYARPSAPSEMVASSSSGIVQRLFVQPGDPVEKGQALAEVAFGETSSKDRALRLLEVDHLRRVLVRLSGAIEGDRRFLAEQRVALQRARSALEASRAVQRELEERLRGQESLTLEQERQDKVLVESGFLSPAAATSRALSRLSQLDTPRARVGERSALERAEIVDLRQLAAGIADAERRLLEQQKEQDETNLRLQSLDLGTTEQLLAASTGRVIGVLKGVGQRVTTGDAVMLLGRDNKQLDFEIYVDASESMSLQPGQIVTVLPSSAPNALLLGNPPLPIQAFVVDVSKSVVDASRLDAPDLTAKYVAVVRARAKTPLTSGQPLKVRIYLGHWSLWDWFAAPFRNFDHQQ